MFAASGGTSGLVFFVKIVDGKVCKQRFYTLFCVEGHVGVHGPGIIDAEEVACETAVPHQIQQPGSEPTTMISVCFSIIFFCSRLPQFQPVAFWIKAVTHLRTLFLRNGRHHDALRR